MVSLVEIAQIAPPARTSDGALVESARAGEMWAKEALFRRHARMASGLAFRIMGRDADVDDLVQESFAQALASLDRLDEPQAFSSWLCAIVVRTAYKTLRRRRLLSRLGLRNADVIDVDSLVSHEAPADVVCELRQIYGAIGDLPPKLRVPFLLRRVEGMPLEDVAKLMGISRATAKRRIAEAAQLLAETT
jgi:RNA polymerase sigma-70 factor (ECF subfamily)